MKSFYIGIKINLYFKGLQKGNKSYLVECLISKKAMKILSMSLVIQPALLFHCWGMYIGKWEWFRIPERVSAYTCSSWPHRDLIKSVK